LFKKQQKQSLKEQNYFLENFLKQFPAVVPFRLMLAVLDFLKGPCLPFQEASWQRGNL
jgi:hypothetical protein